MRGTKDNGRVCCKMWNTFIRPIALSTCILALHVAIFLVASTSSGDCCSKPLLDAGISNLACLISKSSLITKPLSAKIISPGSIIFRKPDSLFSSFCFTKLGLALKI